MSRRHRTAAVRRPVAAGASHQLSLRSVFAAEPRPSRGVDPAQRRLPVVAADALLVVVVTPHRLVVRFVADLEDGRSRRPLVSPVGVSGARSASASATSSCSRSRSLHRRATTETFPWVCDSMETADFQFLDRTMQGEESGIGHQTSRLARELEGSARAILLTLARSGAGVSIDRIGARSHRDRVAPQHPAAVPMADAARFKPPGMWRGGPGTE